VAVAGLVSLLAIPSSAVASMAIVPDQQEMPRGLPPAPTPVAHAANPLLEPVRVGGRTDLLSPIVYQQINAVRHGHGATTLMRHPGLDATAQAWAETMAAREHLAHVPNLAGTANRAMGHTWSMVGENVGVARTVEGVMAAFRASPGHHANTVGPFDQVGIGTAIDRKGRVWVAIQFASTLPRMQRIHLARR
jgi:uncharacterized protein YkwD